MMQLNRRPLRTKALTSAFIAGLSDVLAQRIVSGGYKSWRRTLALAVYGLCYNGPSAHYWQKFLEVLFRVGGGLSAANRADHMGPHGRPSFALPPPRSYPPP